MTASSQPVWGKADRYRDLGTAYKSSLARQTRLLAKLQSAVEMEVSLTQKHLARHGRLTEKIRQYREGLGEALTSEEFKAWCEDEKFASAVRRLHEAASSSN